MKAPDAPVIFATAAEFRRWLEANHARATELWVGYYKKDSGKTSMTYAEALDEALCYGWIDGIAKSFGTEVYANRWTPRRRRSNWSAINIAKIAELERSGRLEPAGRRAFEERDPRRDQSYSYERRQQLPPEVEERIKANGAAWTYWQSESPSYRAGAVHWVLEAKREETRERRVTALISDSAASQRIKPYRTFEAARRAGSTA